MKKYLDVLMGILILGCMLVVLFGFIAPPFQLPPKYIEPVPDAPYQNKPVVCTQEAKVCPDGSAVGRVAPDCEFAECPSILPEEEPTTQREITCEPGSRLVDACIEIYAPVCAQVQVQCVTTPCNPVPETFSNGCFACMQDNVLSYTEGACEADVSIE